MFIAVSPHLKTYFQLPHPTVVKKMGQIHLTVRKPTLCD